VPRDFNPLGIAAGMCSACRLHYDKQRGHVRERLAFGTLTLEWEPTPGDLVVVETGGRPVVVGGDVAVRFGELDEPRTEGQLRVRALEPELVWLAHEHEPWRPRTM
jgi:hypothetical protein